MQRRVFSQEFKLVAINLASEPGVGVSQVTRNLDVAESMLRRWMHEVAAGMRPAFGNILAVSKPWRR